MQHVKREDVQDKSGRRPARYSLAHNTHLHICHVLTLAGGNVSLTADWLGIGLRTLQRYMKKNGMKRESFTSKEDKSA